MSFDLPSFAPESSSRRLSPWLALPLLPICPVAAGAVALALHSRCRQELETVSEPPR